MPFANDCYQLQVLCFGGVKVGGGRFDANGQLQALHLSAIEDRIQSLELEALERFCNDGGVDGAPMNIMQDKGVEEC